MLQNRSLQYGGMKKTCHTRDGTYLELKKVG